MKLSRMGRLSVGVERNHLNKQVGMDGSFNQEVRAVTCTGASGSMHRGSSTKGHALLHFIVKYLR